MREITLNDRTTFLAKGNFPRCHEVTAKWEGGWSDHPSDPGGKTMYGVTLATFRRYYPQATGEDLRKISRNTAETIYRFDFWNPINGDTLAAGVDLAAYDAGVNSGVSRAKKWLLASVGGTPAETVKRICAKRLGFMQSLKIWKTFGKGWSRRVADIEAKGVAWALAATAPAGSVKPALQAEAAKADTQAKGAATGAAGTTVASGGTTAAVATSDHAANTTLLAILAAIAVAVIAVAIWRSNIHNRRREAFEAEAAKL